MFAAPADEMGELDCLLISALVGVEEALCPCGCGFTKEVAHDENRADGWIEARKQVVCYARKAIDQYQDEHRDDIKPGEVIYAVDTHPDAWLNVAPAEDPNIPHL